MDRKWHKSRVKLNVLTVSGPLWPHSGPPLCPVWVHHSSSEWGLLAQHLCQTTATLASAPASPSLSPTSSSWSPGLINHTYDTVQRCRWGAVSSFHDLRRKCALQHSRCELISVRSDARQLWDTVMRLQEEPGIGLCLNVMKRLMTN